MAFGHFSSIKTGVLKDKARAEKSWHCGHKLRASVCLFQIRSPSPTTHAHTHAHIQESLSHPSLCPLLWGRAGMGGPDLRLAS